MKPLYDFKFEKRPLVGKMSEITQKRVDMQRPMIDKMGPLENRLYTEENIQK